jgi:hypothetical protein
MIIILFDAKAPPPRGKVRAEGQKLAGRHPATGQSRQTDGQMGTCRWPVDQIKNKGSQHNPASRLYMTLLP